MRYANKTMSPEAALRDLSHDDPRARVRAADALGKVGAELTDRACSALRKLLSDDAGGKHASELFADAAVGFLERQRGAEKPFFCYVPFTAPHAPHAALLPRTRQRPSQH